MTIQRLCDQCGKIIPRPTSLDEIARWRVEAEPRGDSWDFCTESCFKEWMKSRP